MPAAAMVVLCLPRWVHAQSPELARVEALATRLDGEPTSRDAAVLVEALWKSWDVVGPAPVLSHLEKLVDRRRSARVDRWAREAATLHLAEAALRQGRVEEAREASKRLGAVRSYLVLGPLENEGDIGLESPWPYEVTPEESLTINEEVEGKSYPVSWREVEAPGPLGVLHLDGFLHPTHKVCAYAVTALELESRRDVVIRIGTSGALVLWVNGHEAIRDTAYRQLHGGRFAVQARLDSGPNRIMAKLCGDEVAPSMLLRVTDLDDSPLGHRFSSSIELARRPLKALVGATVPRLLDTPFRRFWQPNAPATRPLNRDRSLASAWYLRLTGSDDPSDPAAPDLAAAAAGDPLTGDVDLDAQLLAAELAEDHNAARQRLEAVVKRFPDDPGSRAALALAIAEGSAPHDALPVVNKALELAPTGVVATMVRGRLLAGMGLPASGLGQVNVVLDRLEHDPPLLLEVASQLAHAARRPVSARSSMSELTDVRADDVSTHRRMVEAARNRGDRDTALRHLRMIESVGWHLLDQRIWAAQALDQLGRRDEAESSLRQLADQAPRFPEAWSALGQLLAGAGRREEAIPPLQRSLALNPQSQEVRELLAHLLDESPMEDTFMEEPETFLARRGGDRQGEHAQWLLDLTVVKVHQSGLSSRFRQIAVEVIDEEGASDFRAHGISFTPDDQQVTVRRARVFRQDGSVEEASGRFLRYLSEPEYRMYYDERAEIIELPRLRPGDVVEIAYRIDDVATRNLFGDFFGDIMLLQGTEPRSRVAYVLIHPRGRQIHAEAPLLDSLRHTESCAAEGDDSCTLLWEATEVPGLRREEDQPPIAELAARLSLSTYDSWDAVGRWWWGLVHDQLTPDDALREVVADLTAGLEDEVDRVRAIHGWVVEHTRYLALEFGIHGYQPYRVTQVVDRGFGDCKDKASLLVTMLGLAGVDASMVLLRTRVAGRIDPRPPSLSLFDHAIAYVPSLDLFLDGTAEQSGTNELPWMDQGVTALIVDQDGSSRLVTTPLDPPSRNTSRQELRVVLSSDEAPPMITVRESIRGHLAAHLRYHFQAAALRQDRLEARLSRSWPGARLLAHQFREVEDREQPIDLEARIEAPSVAVERGGRLTIELARPRELTRRWARRSERRTPLELGTPAHQDEEERVIVIPENLHTAELPPPSVISSEFGSLDMSSRQVAGEIHVSVRLVISVDRVEPGDYQAFRGFCQSVDRALERRLVLE